MKNKYKECKFCKPFKLAFNFSYNILSKIYVFIFARPTMQSLNNLILQLALRGGGYNNCCDAKATGEAKFISILAKINPKLCIDIGANKGDYSKNLLLNTNAKIIAFEPLPKAFKSLSKLKASYPKRFTAINMGVGSKNKILNIYYENTESELASFTKKVKDLYFVDSQKIKAMKVPVVSLDSYCNKFVNKNFNSIDLLKIDVEGFEYEVLIGAKQTINKLKPKYIQIEFNLHHLFRNHSLKKLGDLLPNYSIYQLLPFGDGLIRRNINAPEANFYYYSNFIFIHNDFKKTH